MDDLGYWKKNIIYDWSELTHQVQKERYGACAGTDSDPSLASEEAALTHVKTSWLSALAVSSVLFKVSGKWCQVTWLQVAVSEVRASFLELAALWHMQSGAWPDSLFPRVIIGCLLSSLQGWTGRARQMVIKGPSLGLGTLLQAPLLPGMSRDKMERVVMVEIMDG